MCGSVGFGGGGSTGVSVSFFPEPIMVKMEGGGYNGPILPASLADLVAGSRPASGSFPKSGGGVGSDSENKKTLPKVAATGGSARVKVRYDAHLSSLSLWGGENSRSILAGAVLPTLHGHVFCKNWHLCRRV